MPKAVDLLSVAPKYLGTPYSKMDCQAFVEKCLSDIGIDDNLSGSNAWYRRMTWVGTPEECKRSFGTIPPGAFLFILAHDGKEPEKYKADGIGNAKHIGIFTRMSGKEMCEMSGVEDALKFDHGNGAIHSSASRECVCTSNFSGKAISGGWNRIGLWDRLSYEINADPGEMDGGEIMTAIVTAASGSSVKMRAKPSTSCRTYWDVTVGETVDVISQETGWSHVMYKGKRGYIMTQYLEFGDFNPEQKEDDSIAVPRQELEKIYDTIGDWLGLRG